jgi:hypothetical protein
VVVQVRKLLVKIDQLQQQQQQEQVQQQQQQDAAADRHSAATERYRDNLLEALINILTTIAVFTRNSEIDAAWRELARPTAAMLEHILHVRLVQQTADWSSESVANLWQAVVNLLWSDKDVFGPLLMVAAEETAAAAGVTEDAEPAAAEAAAGQLPVAAAAVSAPQVFSLCISSAKVLTQHAADPYAAMDSRDNRLGCTAALVLEHVQQAATAVLTNSVPAVAVGKGQQRNSISLAAGLPWAVLLLRCVQLGLKWLQLAIGKLMAAAAGDGGRMQRQQQSWDDVANQELLHDTVEFLGQLQDALHVLGLVFSSWCAAATATPAAAGQQPAAAAAVLPLLQKSQQQLQQELLPAVQQVMQLLEVGNSSRQGEQRTIRDMVQARGMLSRWHFSIMRPSFETNTAGSDPEHPQTHALQADLARGSFQVHARLICCCCCQLPTTAPPAALQAAAPAAAAAGTAAAAAAALMLHAPQQLHTSCQIPTPVHAARPATVLAILVSDAAAPDVLHHPTAAATLMLPSPALPVPAAAAAAAAASSSLFAACSSHFQPQLHTPQQQHCPR